MSKNANPKNNPERKTISDIRIEPCYKNVFRLWWTDIQRLEPPRRDE